MRLRRMKINKADKRKAGCRVLVVSSTWLGDLEYLFEQRIGYIPEEVYCFTNELGTKFYYFEEVE
jgi:hypothetical protein